MKKYFFIDSITLVDTCVHRRGGGALLGGYIYTEAIERMQMATSCQTSCQPVQNNETAAMLLYQTNPVRVQPFPYVNTFFWSNKFAWLLHTGAIKIFPLVELFCSRKCIYFFTFGDCHFHLTRMTCNFLFICLFNTDRTIWITLLKCL